MVTYKKGKDVYCRKNGLRMTMQEQVVDGRIICFYINEQGNQAIGVFEASELDSAVKLKVNPKLMLN